MKIIDDLLRTLNYDTLLKDIRQGAFQTAVLTSGCGLASTPHDPGPHHSQTPVKEAGFLLNEEKFLVVDARVQAFIYACTRR